MANKRPPQNPMQAVHNFRQMNKASELNEYELRIVVLIVCSLFGAAKTRKGLIKRVHNALGNTDLFDEVFGFLRGMNVVFYTPNNNSWNLDTEKLRR